MKTPQYSSTGSTNRLAAAHLASEVAKRIQTIQDTLLPFHARTIAGVECAGQCERSGNLGGDFYDFLAPRADEVLAAIGNVAVAGAAGSLLTTGLHVCLRVLGGRGVPLHDVASEVNRMLWQMAPDHAYASMFCARIIPRGGELCWVNAGHEAAVIIRQNLRIERLEPNSPVLGLNQNSIYRERTIAFQPGDMLIALSDGAAEAAEIAAGGASPEEGLLRIVRSGGPIPVCELPARIIEAARGLAGKALRDRTVVVVRYQRRDARGVEAASIEIDWAPFRLAAVA